MCIRDRSGDFARDKGRQVFETLYQSHPEANLVYSHNDEMTMGAIAALEAAGKVPGKDVMLATIDGTVDAAKAVMSGKAIVCVECSPKFGPKAFELIKRLANGEKIPTNVGNIDRVFTKDNPKWIRDKYGDLAWTAKDYLPEAF